MDNQKIKIKGVTGLGHIPFIDRWEGRKDADRNQLRKLEDGFTTPRIVQKCRACDCYTNSLYIEAVEELKGLYVEISIKTAELRHLESLIDTKEELNITMADSDEESMRRAAAKAAKEKNDENRSSALLLRLAELKQEVNNIDETLNHRIAQARATLSEHVANYWQGILHSVAEDNVSVSPVLIEETLSGRDEYQKQYSKVIEMINHWEVENAVV